MALSWFYGSMAAGKSLALLSTAHQYERNKQFAQIWTFHLDNRFGEGVVASRIGVSRPAQVYNGDTEFTLDSVTPGAACVLVDEAQFLTEKQVKALLRISVKLNIPVICYGLRTDYTGNGFEGAKALGVFAERMESLESLCSCGRQASFNMRIDSDGNRVREGEQIVIGDSQYVPKCSTCFIE